MVPMGHQGLGDPSAIYPARWILRRALSLGGGGSMRGFAAAPAIHPVERALRLIRLLLLRAGAQGR